MSVSPQGQGAASLRSVFVFLALTFGLSFSRPIAYLYALLYPFVVIAPGLAFIA